MLSDCVFYRGSREGRRPVVQVAPGRRAALTRVVYAEANGLLLDDLSGLVVRHVCDEPRCVNPGHLVAGTQRQNVQDSMDRDRNVKGERHGCAKLTESQVREIRQRYVKGRGRYVRGNSRDLCREFGIRYSALNAIVNRVAWSHVA